MKKVLIIGGTSGIGRGLVDVYLKNGYKVASIHGDKTQSIRNKAIEDFKNKKSNILLILQYFKLYF